MVSLVRQLGILLRKDLILMRRHYIATAVQLLSPIIFLLLLYVINKAINTATAAQLNPPIQVGAGNTFPRCVSGPTPCITITYAPMSTQNDAIIARLATSQNLTVAQDVKGFAEVIDLATWIMMNPNTTYMSVVFGLYEFNFTEIVALNFPDAQVQGGSTSNTSFYNSVGPNLTASFECYLNGSSQAPNAFNYEMWVNNTLIQVPFGFNVDPQFYSSLNTYNLATQYTELQRAVEEAIVSVVGNMPGFQHRISLQDFPTPSSLSNFDIVVVMGPTFFYCAVMFNFVIIVNQIVTEKQNKLRQGLKMMGITDGAFWLSWFILDLCIVAVASLLTVIFGLVFDFDYFTNANFAANFFLFFFFSLSMVPLAFFVTTFISTAKVAVIVGMALFVMGLIFTAVLFSSPGFVYMFWGNTVSPVWKSIFYFYPPFNFGKVYGDIAMLAASTQTPSGAYEAGPGFFWANMSANPDGGGSSLVIPSPQVSIYWMWLNMIIFSILTWYLDAVLPNEFGASQPWNFFITKRYWGCKRQRVPPLSLVAGHSDFDGPRDEDVVGEEARLRGGGDDDAVKVYALEKHFIPMCRGRSVFAVNGLWLGAENGKVLALLGHNGAGKSTTINILTGLLKPTTGQAEVQGLDVLEDMDEIRAIMGVCPQHDILWDDLTAREHLRLFAAIKGVPGSEIEELIDSKLADVRLLDVGNTYSKTFSGGMKRRLSVAISTIGNPKIVFLDEPTTGMDPVNRRYVWNMIEKEKKDRCVVLTTHSMEEADILGDRIAIMAGGKLVAIGESLHLKERFGKGYRVVVVVEPELADKVKGELTSTIPGLRLQEEAAGSLTYVVPASDIKQMPAFFDYVERAVTQPKSGVKDWGVSHTTLEEVFLELTRASH